MCSLTQHKTWNESKCDLFSKPVVELGQKMPKVNINSVDPYRRTVAGRSALLTAHVETCQTL